MYILESQACETFVFVKNKPLRKDICFQNVKHQPIPSFLYFETHNAKVNAIEGVYCEI